MHSHCFATNFQKSFHLAKPTRYTHLNDDSAFPPPHKPLAAATPPPVSTKRLLWMAHYLESQSVLFFCDWLSSLRILSSGLVQVVARVRKPVLFKGESCSVARIHRILSIHSSTGHSGRFLLPAGVNDADADMSVQYFCETLLSILLSPYPEVGILGRMGILFLIF